METSSRRWLIYGANGYSGRLILEEALRRGHRPMIAGRNLAQISELAARHDLPFATVELADAPRLTTLVAGVDLILHAAGPFTHTAAPMIAACLAAGTHYLDLSGEIDVYRRVYSHDREARERGIAMISGVGFDVVPTDCLALHVALQVPDATELELAIDADLAMSSGTARTTVEGASIGGLVRRNGSIVSLPMAAITRRVRFPTGDRGLILLPFSDLESAYRSTGIRDITTYLAVPPMLTGPARLLAPIVTWIARRDWIRRAALGLASRMTGPTAREREMNSAHIWARAHDGRGTIAEAWLDLPDPYSLTAVASVSAVERVLRDNPTGGLTPAQAFGAEFVTSLPGVRLRELTPGASTAA